MSKKTKLPVVGSTTSSTSFCLAELEGPNNTTLFIDGNGKITRENGTLLAPKPNAFSLEASAVSGDPSHCPSSTPTCRSACYVGPLEKAQAGVYEKYRHNTDQMKIILADPALASWWVMKMAKWIGENAPGGFRWHVSGDVFSFEYACWIADVCREAAQVPFWIYTRSFNYLSPLAEVSTLRGGNLAINLSADVDNYSAAYAAAEQHGSEDGPERLRICYLTVDGEVPGLDKDDVVFCDYALRPRAVVTLSESEWWQSLTQFQRGLVCPVDAFGKAENRRCGPCTRCLT